MIKYETLTRLIAQKYNKMYLETIIHTCTVKSECDKRERKTFLQGTLCNTKQYKSNGQMFY